MKLSSLVVVLGLFVSCAFGDSWTPATPQTVSSPEGKSLLRTIPPKRLDKEGKKWSKMLFIVYRLDEGTQDYQETTRFHVEGNPLDCFINDTGDRIATLDQYFGVGQGSRVVAVYNGKGTELKTWALKDFYDGKKIGHLPNTTSSVLWHGSTGWTGDQEAIYLSKPDLLVEKGIAFDDYLLDVRKLKITKKKPVVFK
ncbi:MAG: hypothetical protein EOP83_21540 [Verrucomicrobiaceae bacterium]|nr:MAG: hypothetical protein EOP83_21540 [Verrucomicrobiaceae bacterium]